MDFKVGDILAWGEYGEQPRLLVKLNCANKPEWPEDDFQVIYLNQKHDTIAHGNRSSYTKINPSKKLIKIAKRNIKLILHMKRMDNLTYVEICARLREQEESLSNV